MIFYLSNVDIAVNISQPSIRIGGCLHALIHIFFYTGGLKAPNHFGTLTPNYYRNVLQVFRYLEAKSLHDHTDANSSVDPGRAWGLNERPPQTESPPNTS